MFRRSSSAVWALVLTLPALAASPLREAPNPAAKPANQLVVSGNACGPTALLNAFRFGNNHWQRGLLNINGTTDKEQILTLIRGSGMRPSKHLNGHPRWSRRGVNIADLCDMANETTQGQLLPKLTQEVLFVKPGESQEKLLRRVHQRLDTSLAKGLPPLISLRRYALRRKEWVILDAHFVTLITMPRKLEKGARSFPVTYIDPWGGKIANGNVAIPDRAVLAGGAGDSPCLEAAFPDASVGKKLLRSGESHTLTISAALGRW
jgi:hypothetical protein